MTYSIYRESTDSAASKAGRVLGLARCGIAASDTRMNIELIGSAGLQSLFVAIAVLANDILGETMDMEAAANKPVIAANGPETDVYQVTPTAKDPTSAA